MRNFAQREMINKPVDDAVDVQIQPRVVNNEAGLQDHKDDVGKVDDKVPARPAFALAVPHGYQLYRDKGNVAKPKYQ